MHFLFKHILELVRLRQGLNNSDFVPCEANTVPSDFAEHVVSFIKTQLERQPGQLKNSILIALKLKIEQETCHKPLDHPELVRIPLQVAVERSKDAVKFPSYAHFGSSTTPKRGKLSSEHKKDDKKKLSAEPLEKFTANMPLTSVETTPKIL